MTPKHTPGPWRQELTAKPGTHQHITGHRVGRIADVHCCPAEWGDPEANARLVAAAPEMYELVTDLAQGGGSARDLNACIRDAIALLAKIEGAHAGSK